MFFFAHQTSTCPLELWRAATYMRYTYLICATVISAPHRKGLKWYHTVRCTFSGLIQCGGLENTWEGWYLRWCLRIYYSYIYSKDDVIKGGGFSWHKDRGIMISHTFFAGWYIYNINFLARCYHICYSMYGIRDSLTNLVKKLKEIFVCCQDVGAATRVGVGARSTGRRLHLPRRIRGLLPPSHQV